MQLLRSEIPPLCRPLFFTFIYLVVIKVQQGFGINYQVPSRADPTLMASQKLHVQPLGKLYSPLLGYFRPILH